MSPEVPRDRTVRYSGRDFTPADLQTIWAIIAKDPKPNRQKISYLVCDALAWHKPNGTRKDMSCRVAMLRMERDGLIELPPPQSKNNNRSERIQRTLLAVPGAPIDAPVAALTGLRLELVTRKTSALWNEYIDRYHYLGFKKLPGAQLRYFAVADQGVLALFGFGAAAWKTKPRDLFIGWIPEQRERNLHLIVNNARFLILPWVRSRNLASHLIARVSRRLPDDWFDIYAYRPVLIETFVDVERFQGTCYKAANWARLGDTTGRGKLGGHHLYGDSVKAIWVYPLSEHFRRELCLVPPESSSAGA